MATKRSSRRCPHVIAGVSLEGWLDKYKCHSNKFGNCKKVRTYYLVFTLYQDYTLDYTVYIHVCYNTILVDS